MPEYFFQRPAYPHKQKWGFPFGAWLSAHDADKKWDDPPRETSAQRFGTASVVDRE